MKIAFGFINIRTRMANRLYDQPDELIKVRSILTDQTRIKDERIYLVFFFLLSLLVVFIFGIIGCGLTLLAFLTHRIVNKKRAEKTRLKIKQKLPMLMEHLVMMVQAGHDVISAIRHIESTKQQDPVSQCFRSVVSYAEQGFSFVESLEETSKSITETSLRHVLIHLSLAYRQGGELILPLRELSDACQLQYQEEVEERIAKLPVQATIPLLLIFSGLIMFFVTPPVLQVLKITNQNQL